MHRVLFHGFGNAPVALDRGWDRYVNDDFKRRRKAVVLADRKGATADDRRLGRDRSSPVPERHAAIALQQGILFQSQFDPGAGVDLIQMVMDWPEPLDTDATIGAWQSATQRHPVLRTAFAWSPPHTVTQQVHAEVNLPISLHHWSDTDGDRTERLERFLVADRAQEFDIRVAPLARVSLIRHRSDHHTIVFTFHHAILDGRSAHMLLTEVFGGATAALPDRRPFQDFVVWANQRNLDGDRAFWQEQLRGVTLPTPLPLTPARDLPARGPESVREIVATLSEAEHDAVRRAAQAAAVPLSTMVNAAWAVLLHRYSGERDVVFGATRSCRHGTITGADSIIGLMINTVPLRVTVDPALPVRSWLAAVRAQIEALRAYQVTPLPAIREHTHLSPATPLFESLLMYEHRDLQSSLDTSVPGWNDRSVQVRRNPGSPLTLCAFGEPTLRIFLYHDQRRLPAEHANHLLHHLTTCLIGMAAGLDAPVSALPLSDDEEVRRIISEWAGHHPAYPAGATIPELFADQARRHPDRNAVSGPDGTLTYAELDARANRLAHLLVRHGVTVDAPVAIALPRSVRLVVALLAVLKAGGAYLPIDPNNPPGRIRELLTDSGDPLLLAADGGPPPPDEVKVLRLDRIDAELAELPTTAPASAARPTSLAYISYTSGSTGAPKGVAVPHRAVIRLIHQPGYLHLGPEESVLHLASAAFDASTLEVWGALLNGARLVVAPPDPLDLTEIAHLLRIERISVLWLTAGLFHQLIEHDPECLAGVGQLLSGGDVLSPEAVRKALRVRKGQPVINGYGPTENTTFTSCHRMTDPQSVTESVPIGRPVPRTTVYVLDAALRPVPVGVPGELYTGGDGLARGYQGQPGRTAERFLPDPFSTTPGARMYRTGDRVRWRSDGTLEFLGRIDRQVKIRGFRVEPAEVEAVLRAHPLVREVAVVMDGEGERKRLLAYLSPGSAAAEQQLVQMLDAHVRRQLPPYLRPATYVVLPALPLNRNGKVDRAALPPPLAAAPPTMPDKPLTDPTQIRLAALWAELLEARVTSPDDDFFALGGNSLLATRLTFLVADHFGINLPVRVLYDHHTLAALAAQIDQQCLAPAVDAPRITARDRTVIRSGPERPHLLRPTPGPWGLWRWTALRAAGFPIRPLIEFGDPGYVSVTDTLLAAEDAVARARRNLLDRLWAARRAGPAEQRAGWNRADRVVRRGGLPDALPHPVDPALVTGLRDAQRALADAAARLRAAQQAFTQSHEELITRSAEALRTVAADPTFREAVTWQNRHALRTGVDQLLRAAPAKLLRNSKHRQHAALVATYLQRYCAKNDTIGFFGPVNWATFDKQGVPVRIRHGASPLRSRTVFFENWTIAELAETIANRDRRLRPWLIPRRLPFLSVVNDQLLLPLTPPTPLPYTVARLLSACDGIRTAGEIADELIADPACEVDSPEAVYQLLARLRDERRISWSLEVPKEDLFPERALRQRLGTVTDPDIAGPALATLDRLEQARDRVTAAAGDTEKLGSALADLEQTFSELTGLAPTRRSGEVYAGRTLVYEDCEASAEVSLSPTLAGTLWPGLSLLLESARWFTYAGAALFHRACLERYRELVERSGNEIVPFADFWHWANDLLFYMPEKLLAPVVRGLQNRWARILDGAEGDHRRLQLDSAAIADRVAEAFAVPRPGWTGAYHHSPDVMLAAHDAAAISRGDFLWVVGEVHPGINTVRSAVFAAHHPQPEALRAAMSLDLPGPRITLAATGEEGGAPARLTDKLITERDRRLLFGHDSCGLDPRTAMAVGDCVIEPRRDGLWVRTRDGRHQMPLAEMLGEPLMLQLVQCFDIRPAADHQPRITVDRVVLARESWRFDSAGLSFAHTPDQAERFLETRRWQVAAGLPRYVFVKTPTEKKPFFVDFASLLSVDGFARAIRRVQSDGEAGATIRLTEMLPTPEQLWLTDVDGERRTAEFRLVAVDTRTPMDPGTLGKAVA
ncbi:MAG TPA: amino acid adenylation domain-containing protein [Micromonospora sp.]|nr:amino acid adenylation domain-containing protein [Micromonospora sp.]